MNDADVGRYGIWRCGSCSIEKVGTAHQRRQKYCSVSCYGKEKHKSVLGEANPNYKGVGIRVCNFCNSAYHSYSRTKNFCSRSCRSLHRKILKEGKANPPRAERKLANQKSCAHCSKLFFCNKSSSKTTCSPSCAKLLRESRATIKTCAMCGVNYKSSPSQNRKYCSYRCHLDSGGAFKAGMAAAKAKMKYGPKRDANHAELFAVLRKHCAVYDVSTSGMGIPDGLAWINGAWHLFDVKNPKTGYGRRGLNPIQKKWLSQAQGGPIYLLYTVEDAENFATGKFDGLKFEAPEALDLLKSCV